MVAHYIAQHFPEHLLRTNKLTADQSKIETQAKEAFEAALMAIDAGQGLGFPTLNPKP